MDVWGFDYDYTLADYTDDMLTLIYDLARDYLIAKMEYCFSKISQSMRSFNSIFFPPGTPRR